MIRDASSREIVTVIQVLSPSNKDRGSTGFDSYERKRTEVLRSRVNFVEIDLLREGFRYPISGRIPQGEYRVHVSKGHERPKGWVWPMRLPERLPSILIPLKRGESDISLDLQNLLDTTHERAGYDLILDYSKPPAVPLTAGLQAWATELLSARTEV